MLDELLVRAVLQIDKQNADIPHLSVKNSNHREREPRQTESVEGVRFLHLLSSPPQAAIKTSHASMLAFPHNIYINETSKEEKIIQVKWTPPPPPILWGECWGLWEAKGHFRYQPVLQLSYMGKSCRGIIFPIMPCLFFRTKANHWSVAAFSNLVSSRRDQVSTRLTYRALALKISSARL